MEALSVGAARNDAKSGAGSASACGSVTGREVRPARAAGTALGDAVDAVVARMRRTTGAADSAALPLTKSA
ncbi:MAG TPA: hypothetical protein VN894_19580, partial [Polyangiaceae bacterium]|nr:hypothetical protein [Polyangiaceae bacterium]